MKLKGNLSISKPINGDGSEYVSIRVKDRLSTTRFIDIKVGLKEFSDIIFGLGDVACEYEVRGLEKIGRYRQLEKMEFEMPMHDFSNRKNAAIKEAELRIKLKDAGWVLWDTFSSQSSFFSRGRRDWARCSIVRFVDIEPAT